MYQKLNIFSRISFLVIFLFSLVPIQTAAAVSFDSRPEGISASDAGILDVKSSAAPGPEPAPGPYEILPQGQFAPGLSSVETKLPAELAKQLSYANPPYSSYRFSNGLEIRPITAYNLIVDSNVLSPSSYGPSAATLGAQFCNTTASEMTNVWAYVGNFDKNNDGTLGDTDPGVYPVHDDTTHVLFEATNFDARFPHLATSPTAVDYGDPSRFYALEQESGSLSDAADASRYIGTLQAGECETQYWLVSYPRKATIGGSWVDVTGGVKPEDDLWLWYHFWATSDATSQPSYFWRPVTMRNEISAMANKIWPNGDNKVPQQYLDAIQDALGWDTITPSGTSNAFPGDTVTSQGIWYDFGVVGAGFDNNRDLVPDRNAWVQPIGDAGGYDPGCFRLVKTYGLVIIKLNDGTEQLIPFVDQLYFENIPDNNNGAVGLVYYQYIALDGACTAGLTPYQEVASGYDNEKFNGDFGAGIPPLQSQETNITLDKTGDASVAAGNAIYYTMTFTLPQDNDAGMSFTVGNLDVNMPLVFQEAIPSGTTYDAGTAQFDTLFNPAIDGIILYSHDGGVTWSTTEAPANTVTHIQWWLDSEVVSQDSSSVQGRVRFSVTVPGTYTPPVVNDTGCLKLGNGNCFTEDTHTTLITGARSISGTVFCDDGPQYTAVGQPCATNTNSGTLANGTLDSGGGEPGMQNVSVYLYYDSNGNATLDATDTLLNSTVVTNASGFYTFTGLPNGTYFTKVIKSDSDVQETYGLTTPESRIAVLNGVDVTGLDYGFAPPLSIEKSVDKTTAVGGSIFTYTITLNNNLPGSGAPGSACVYTVWAGKANADATGNPPGGNNANTRWQDPSNAQGRPDGQVSYTVMSDATDLIGLTNFNTADMGGSITSVAYRLYVNERLNLDDDQLDVKIYDGTSAVETDSYYYNTIFTGGTGSRYVINGSISYAPAGGWKFSDFSAATNRYGLQLTGNRIGGSSGDLELDAAAFVITTNQTCRGADTTLDPVPLTDVFRNDHFTLVSTNPPYNSTSISGTDTTISWNNVGPIYPGGFNQVTVTLKSNDIATTSSDTATSANAKFANGVNANSPVSDTVTVNITDNTDPRSLSGKVFDDNGTTGWTGAAWSAGGSSTGLDAADAGIQAALVTLYQCLRISDGTPVTDAGSNRTCAEESGEWRSVQTTYTNATGDYSFLNLVRGYYYVQADISTVAGPQRADVNQTGVCTTCDSRSNDPNNTSTEELEDAAFVGDLDDNTSLSHINFGYDLPAGTFSLGDRIYYDWNGDGTQDSSDAEGYDEGIDGVTVDLLRPDGSIIGSQVTVDGFYQFTGLSAGVYTVRVSDSTLPSFVSQTGDPDETGTTCSTCDNRSTITLSASNDTRDFGYKPYGTGQIGDTVWRDMNGNGTQSGTQETGISGITVRLQVDLDGNGTWVTAKTATTDSNGNYLFSNLPFATYRVVADDLDTDLPNDAFGTNYEPTTVTTYETTLNSTTASVLTDDFGFAPLASIGDTVYYDVNSNGTQDFGEHGIDGVTVTLHTFTDADADGRYDPGETLGAAVASMTTATVNGVAGFYQFVGVLPGYYVVQVTPLANMTLTGDPNTDGFSCAAGVLNNPADPGEPSSLVCDHRDGMRLYYGTNYSGADFGYLLPGYVGDTVWIDTDGDGVRDFDDANNNSVQDLGEPYTEAGIPNITVTLTYCGVDNNCGTAGDNTTSTTETDPDGFYSFTGLDANGSFQITLDTGDADWPSGLTSTAPSFEKNDASPDTQTDFTTSSGNLNSINGTACTNCGLQVDFGYRYVGNTTIAGTVCLEVSSSDGQCDNINGADAAYQGVTVYLYLLDDANSNGRYDAGETVTQIDSLQTDSSGNFSFTDLPNGQKYYIVALAAPQDELDLTTVETEDTPSETTDLVENTAPDGDTVSALQVINVAVGDTSVTEVDFAFESNADYDFGDLPETYSTTLEGTPDGPRHTVPTAPATLYLGTAAPDAETNGIPSADASSDGADEDGVTLLGTWVNGDNGGSLQVVVTGSGYLVGWIDLNEDGDFTDGLDDGDGSFNEPGEWREMIASQAVTSGTHTFSVDIPTGTFGAGDVVLNTRFRLFPSAPPIPALASSGAASSGEVEDYQFSWSMTVDKDTSTANVMPGSQASYTIVLANTGNRVLSDVSITDTLPGAGQAWAWTYATISHTESGAGTNFTSDECVDGLNLPDPLDADTNTIECGKWNIGVGGSVTITVTVNVPAATPVATYDNTVAASSAQTGTIDDDGIAAQDSNTPPTQDPETDEDVNVTRTLTLRKSWVNANLNDAVNVTAIRSGITIGTLASTANTANETDTGTAIAVNSGDVITFSETFTGGSSSNYTSAVTCSGATDTDLTDGLTVNAADVAVVCTYTNTRKTATVTLQKTWANAVVNDTATVSLDGTNDDSLSSTADTANETDADASPTTVYSGETVTISETLGGSNSGSYTGTLACSGATDTDLTGGLLTITAADTAITCTYTNATTITPPSISKSFSPNPIAAGGNSTLTFTITNPNAGTALTGVAFTDNLPSGVTLSSAVTTPQCDGDMTGAAGGSVITLANGDIPAGSSCTITATVTAPAVGTYLNTTGNVSSTNGGTGNTASATLGVITAVKSVVATSEESTSGSNVSIGEIVRYRLVFELPQGSTTNLQVLENIVGNLSYLNDGTTKVAFICNGGAACASSSDPAIGSSPLISGSTPAAPTFVLPSTAIANNDEVPTTSPFSSGDDPLFSLGNVTNNDNDSDAEYVVIEFNSLVLNYDANRNTNTRGNTFTVRVGGSNVVTSNNVGITIVEPALSAITKSVTVVPTDAGDTVEYTLTFTNTGTSPAFDIVITDTLNAVLTAPVTVTGSTTGGACGSIASSVSGSYSAPNVTATVTCLNPLGTATVTISAPVSSSAEAGKTFTNTASATYTSLPGNTGTPPGANNPTGSGTPGGTGSSTGERNGSGGTNDYTASSNTVSSTLATPAVDKRDPAATATIGETVAYNILVTLPEGITRSLSVVDAMPAGMEYQSYTLITTAAASGGLLAADYNGTVAVSTTPAAGTTGDLTFAFGDTTTTADGVSNNNAFVLQVVAQVQNVVGNQEGGTLTNTASLTYTDPNDSSTDTVTDPTAPSAITVVEPTLNVAKSASTSTPAPGTLTYTLTITHTAASDVPAFNTRITDTLPAGLSGLTNVNVSSTSSCATGVVNTPTASGLDVTIGTIPLACTVTITYDVTVAGSDGDTRTNDVDMTWTSLPGAVSGERTGADGPSGPLNDYADTASVTVTVTITSNAVISNYIWNDADGDGTQDAGESGLGENIRVYIDQNGNDKYDVGEPFDLTDTSGIYAITDLAAGTYSVRVDTGSLPSSFVQTYDLDGAGTAHEASVTLTSGQTRDDVDFGYQQRNASIGDYVWNDTNGDGLQAGETGIDGVTVDLYRDTNNDGSIDAGDTNLGTATTAGGGLYSFTGLPAGNYLVTVTDTASVLSNFTRTGGADPHDVTLSAGQAYTTADFGYRQTNASIGDYVWNDVNGDGLQTGESGINGVTVVLYRDNNNDGAVDGGDTNLGTRTTAGGGLYSFTGLPAGNYLVDVTDTGGVLSGYARTGGADPHDVTLTVGASYDVADFGYQQLASIGNYVWNDIDADGRQDAGESGIDGVTVELYTSGGALSASTTTAGGGAYSFNNVAPGDYYVKFTLLSGYVFTTQNSGSDVTDSDADTTTGNTATTTLSAGESEMTWDAGMYWPVDLTVTKTDGVTSYLPGGSLTYTIKVWNAGPSDTVDASFSDSRPANISSWNWTCAATGSASCGATTNGTGNISVTDIDLPADAGGTTHYLTYTISATVSNTASGQLTNTATVTAPSGVRDTNTTNNSASDTDDLSTGALVIVKDAVPNDAQDFAYTVTGSGLSAFSLDDDADASLSNTQTFSNLLANGTYAVTETTQSGWSLTNISCSGATSSTVTIGGDADFDAGDTGVSVVLAEGETVTCIYTNTKQPILTLEKTVVNNNGGTAVDTAWTLTATGPTTISGTEGQAAITSAVIATGTYTLSESGGASGYMAGSWSCTNGVTVTASQITLAAGQTTLCTITNDDQLASLTLVKQVTNDNGGTAVPGAWTLQAEGVTFTSGVAQNVDAGTYTLSESGGPSGYTAGNWSCTNSVAVVGGDITLANGQSTTCTITNDDQPASLTLVKSVTNDHGGTALPSAWTLQAGSTTFTTGVAQNINAATYTLSESGGPSAYTAGNWSCSGASDSNPNDGLSLAVGETVTCTIVNNDQPGAITGQVRLDTDNDGDMTESDSGIGSVTISLYADDGTGKPTGAVLATTTTNGSGNYTFTNLAAGSYVVVETNLSGYTSTNDRDASTNNSIDQIAIVVTIGNTNSGNDFLDTNVGLIRGQVRWDTDSDGDPLDGDSGINNVTVRLLDSGGNTVATTTTNSSGNYTFTNVPPGSYTVLEVDPSGYTSTYDTQGTNDNRIAVTLAAGATSEGNDFLDSNLGTVSGHLYLDTNGDGDQDAGEPDLAGVNVVITASNGALQTVTTDGSGDWTATVPSGSTSANVDESDPQYPIGYTQTEGDDPTTVTAVAGNNTNAGNDGYYLPSTITKSLLGTSESSTTGSSVAIGEIVTYQVVVRIPPGEFANASLVDNMQQGLSFVDCQSITASGGVTTSISGGFTQVCSNPAFNAAAVDSPDVQRLVTFNLGTLNNATSATQTLTLTYRAVVLDIASNVAPVGLTNAATWDWDGITPVTAPNLPQISIVEPRLSIDKTVDNNFVAAGSELTFTLTIAHVYPTGSPVSSADAFDVLVEDILPAEFEYVTGSLNCTIGAQAATNCSYNPVTRAIQAQWSQFVLGTNNGQVRFRVRVLTVPSSGSITNTARVEWTSLPGSVGQQTPNYYSTERYYDPAAPVGVNSYNTSDSLTLTPLGGGRGGGGGGSETGESSSSNSFSLPFTGFAPDKTTVLSGPPVVYAPAGKNSLEIATLGLKLPIMGVPLKNGNWNVDWLWDKAGWLEGTAYPGWEGNSVITAHLVTSDGKPGPFARLRMLRIGELIVVNANGNRYTYKVVSNRQVEPNDISVLRHEEKAWLTLITCQEYNEETETYLKRVVVRAVLVDITPIK